MKLNSIVNTSIISKLPVSKLIIAALAIGWFISIKSCQTKDSEIITADMKLDVYKAMTTKFVKTLNKKGQEVSTQKALVLARDKKLEKTLLENSNLQKLNVQIRIASNAAIADIIAHYAGVDSSTFGHITTINSTGDTVRKECVAIGTKFNKLDVWYSIAGSLQKIGVSFDSITFKDTTTINLGSEKQPGLFGFLKEREDLVEVVHSSPYVSTTGMQNITFRDPPKWYNRRITLFGGGVAVGVSLVLGSAYLLYK